VVLRCRVRCGYHLIRICAPAVTNGNRFATPDQLCAATSETLPTPQCEFRRISVQFCVPPFHRLDCDAITDMQSVCHQRLPQRRISTRKDLGITWNVDAERTQPRLKSRNVLDRGQPGNCLCAHVVCRCLGNASTATTPSIAKTMSAMQPAK